MIKAHAFCILYVFKWKAACINARWFDLLLRLGIIAWMHNVAATSLLNNYNNALGADSLSRLFPGYLQVRKLFLDYFEVFQYTVEGDGSDAKEREREKPTMFSVIQMTKDKVENKQRIIHLSWHGATAVFMGTINLLEIVNEVTQPE